MSNVPAPRVRNQLLARLPLEVYERLTPHLEPVTFEISQVVYESQAEIDFVYFPLDCVLSAVVLMKDGDMIEVATVGCEGAAGLATFFGPTFSPHRVFIQVPGTAVRIEAATLAQLTKHAPGLHDLLLRHYHAFVSQISQSVACNGLHNLNQRLARWLLMTHDRIEGDDVPLTHEFLSFMLGVRRPGVTDALKALEAKGLISTARGTIKVVDRAGLEAVSCECYHDILAQYERHLGTG